MDCEAGVKCRPCNEKRKDWVTDGVTDFCCYGLKLGSEWTGWNRWQYVDRCPVDPDTTTTPKPLTTPTSKSSTTPNPLTTSKPMTTSKPLTTSKPWTTQSPISTPPPEPKPNPAPETGSFHAGAYVGFSFLGLIVILVIGWLLMKYGRPRLYDFRHRVGGQRLRRSPSPREDNRPRPRPARSLVDVEHGWDEVPLNHFHDNAADEVGDAEDFFGPPDFPGSPEALLPAAAMPALDTPIPPPPVPPAAPEIDPPGTPPALPPVAPVPTPETPAPVVPLPPPAIKIIPASPILPPPAILVIPPPAILAIPPPPVQPPPETPKSSLATTRERRGPKPRTFLGVNSEPQTKAKQVKANPKPKPK